MRYARRTFLLLAPLLILVCLVSGSAVEAAETPAASFLAARSLLVSSSSPGNAYAAGISVVRTAVVEGDFSALGGSIITAAPVSGDELLVAGSVYSRSSVAGDLKAIGGSVTVDEPVGGDLLAFGLSVHDKGKAEGSVFLIGANVTVSNGAGGPVTIYANNVSLGGDFAGDVHIITSGHVSLAASTTIAGTLSYEGPEEANIPESAVIQGGVEYTNASYLPDAGTSRILALMSIGLFLLVRVVGALILAGLLAGLFPRLAWLVVERASTPRVSKVLLTTLLGFAVFVVTPVIMLLLAITFVGVGLALLMFVAYGLIVLLSLMYAGIMLGSLLARQYAHRDAVLWRDGVLGMLALSLITLIPYIGVVTLLLFTSFAAGALLLIFFQFAFSGDEPVEPAESIESV